MIAWHFVAFRSCLSASNQRFGQLIAVDTDREGKGNWEIPGFDHGDLLIP